MTEQNVEEPEPRDLTEDEEDDDTLVDELDVEAEDYPEDDTDQDDEGTD